MADSQLRLIELVDGLERVGSGPQEVKGKIELISSKYSMIATDCVKIVPFSSTSAGTTPAGLISR